MRFHILKILGILVSIQLCLAGCGGSPKQVAKVELSGDDDTKLGAGDVFEVRVYEEKELTGKFRIAQDGTVDYPFIGHIRVAGLEPPEAADLIAKKLRDGGYLREPQVSVLVEQYNSKRITVLGAIAKPGAYPVTNGLTIVQLVSLAGGFNGLASENDTLVTRKVRGKLTRYRVRVREMMEGHIEDFAMQAGDSVFVPERVF